MDVCVFPWLFERKAQVRSLSQRPLVCRWLLGSGQTCYEGAKPEDFVRGKTFSKESRRKLHQDLESISACLPFRDWKALAN